MFFSQPTQVLRRTVTIRVLLGLLLGPLALASGFGAWSMAGEKPPEYTGAAILAAFCLLFAGLLWYFFQRESQRVVRLYDDGIESVVGSRHTELRWAEITEIWFEAIRVQAGGLVGAAIGAAVNALSKPSGLDARNTSITVKLIGREGAKLSLTSNDKGVVQAFSTLTAKVNPRLLDQARATVQNGAVATYGPVGISVQGVAFNRKAPVPFGEIESLAINGGKLRLKKQKAWLDAFSVPIKKIPNVFVLIDLYTEFATGARVTAPPALGRNLTRSTYV